MPKIISRPRINPSATPAAFADYNFALSSAPISLTNSAASRTARATDLQTFRESIDDSHEPKLGPPGRCAKAATNVSWAAIALASILVSVTALTTDARVITCPLADRDQYRAGASIADPAMVLCCDPKAIALVVAASGCR
jgi:hypothetical protein